LSSSRARTPRLGAAAIPRGWLGIPGFEEWTIARDGLIAMSPGHYDEAEYDRQLRHGVDSSTSMRPGT